MNTWHKRFCGNHAFAHLSPWLAALPDTDWPDLAVLNTFAERQNLRNAASRPVRFATQSIPCGQRDYEFGIHATGQVPTRAHNWHDLFNALTWLAFPHSKATLNAVHQDALRPGDNRLPASDAATLFDESGLVLVSEDDALANLLIARRWEEALILRRADWRHVRAYVFGHAVLEKLLNPWPGITAKCLYLNMPAECTLDTVDSAIARHWQRGQMAADTLSAAPFPLPVLGIPGWWPANEHDAFYADPRVFRPARQDHAVQQINRAR